MAVTDHHSTYRIVGEGSSADPVRAEIVVDVIGEEKAGIGDPSLPVRVVVTASDGTHPDGAGFGVYADGRFFAEGRFVVTVPPGQTRIELRSGPNYVPLDLTVSAKAGRRVQLRAALWKWFSPETLGWYGGDNHVHAQHDAAAVMRTGIDRVALQARANGLSFVTEAGSHVPYDELDRFSSDTFLLRRVDEAGSGCFVGHLNTPGIAEPITEEYYTQFINKRPLPAQAIVRRVHELNGAAIHTHPLSPPNQLHWMGATEILSDAVLGFCADALDIGGWDESARYGTELLWFSVLNLGNKVACSSYTDSTLERKDTLTPGDRRVYCHAAELSYPAIVEALRHGRTVATNGGPIFPLFSVESEGPGATIEIQPGVNLSARLEIHSLYPLKSAAIYRNGNIARSFDVEGREGTLVLSDTLPAEDGASWYIARVEDQDGHWAITSPVYAETAALAPETFASALLFEISNCTRFPGQLRRQFYGHIIVTVPETHRLTEVCLLKDGQVVERYTPSRGDRTPSAKIPVTEFIGEYEAGWLWHPAPESCYHFLADYPVSETGWYAVRALTDGGHELASDAVHFDADTPNSNEICVAHLTGENTRYVLWGYGEEMPLAEITTPFQSRGYGHGDWWYVHNDYWRLRATFDGQPYEVEGRVNAQAGQRFRPHS